MHALDQALRKDLGRYQNIIKDVELVDYKVPHPHRWHRSGHARAGGEPGQAGTGARWFTVGVSSNIVDASFEALTRPRSPTKFLTAGAAAA